MTTSLVRQLLEAGVHFGHQTRRWNPKMKPFIFGARAGIHIIDLEKTEKSLTDACEFLEDIASQGKIIMYVGTKRQARLLLEAEAKRAGMPFVINRWLGGMLTNFQTIKKNIDKLIELREQKESGLFERVSKKDAKRLARHLERLEENFDGLSDTDKVPDCLFIVDTKREHLAVHEANLLNIPIVAVCDTNTNPEIVKYPIPGNDDAMRALKLLISMATNSIIAGREQWKLNVSTQEPVSPVEPEESQTPEKKEEQLHPVTTTIQVNTEPEKSEEVESTEVTESAESTEVTESTEEGKNDEDKS